MAGTFQKIALRFIRNSTFVTPMTTHTQTRTRLYFSDLPAMRQFRIYVLAHDIPTYASFVDPAKNYGWMECDLSESELAAAIREPFHASLAYR